MLPDNKRPKDVQPIVEPERPTKTTKVMNKLIVVFLVVIALGLGVFLKWSLQPTDVLKVNNSPFPVRTVADPSNETGGIVFLTVDFCKNTSAEGTIRMSYVSKSTEIFLPISPEKLEKGCQKTEVPVVIPRDLPKDSYKIKFRATYNLNPLKKNIIVDFESKLFEVGAQK